MLNLFDFTADSNENELVLPFSMLKYTTKVLIFNANPMDCFSKTGKLSNRR